MKKRIAAWVAIAVVLPIILVVGWRIAQHLHGEALVRKANRLSPAVSTPIPDDQVVLVKKGKTLGVLILRDQTAEMPRCSVRYEWYYRSDGKGTFLGSESAEYKHGTGMVSSHSWPPPPSSAIKFGPFSVGWFPHRTGSGWLHYDHIPEDPVAPDDLRICVTPEISIERPKVGIENIDATDSKWTYKASDSDSGVTASGKPK